MNKLLSAILLLGTHRATYPSPKAVQSPEGIVRSLSVPKQLSPNSCLRRAFHVPSDWTACPHIKHPPPAGFLTRSTGRLVFMNSGPSAAGFASSENRLMMPVPPSDRSSTTHVCLGATQPDVPDALLFALMDQRIWIWIGLPGLRPDIFMMQPEVCSLGTVSGRFDVSSQNHVDPATLPLLPMEPIGHPVRCTKSVFVSATGTTEWNAVLVHSSEDHMHNEDASKDNLCVSPCRHANALDVLIVATSNATNCVVVCHHFFRPVFEGTMMVNVRINDEHAAHTHFCVARPADAALCICWSLC